VLAWTRRPLPLAGLAALPLLLSGCGVALGSSGPSIQVYSARTYGAEKAYEQFTEETGIEVEFLNGKDAELRERLQAEGSDTKADVFLTVDAANLALAADQGLLQPTTSAQLQAAVPASLRDPQMRWFGLSQRARVIIYNKRAVRTSELSTYAALGDDVWKDRLCFRTSTSPYTQSLVASMITHGGVQKTRATVQGWMANDPQILANDVEIVRTVDAGGCDVGITNHYYVARALAEDPQLDVGVFFPDQATTGTHVNISGAGVVRGADDAADARVFLEWLATKGQELFVEGNYEYPVNPGAERNALLREFGEFRQDELNVGELGARNAEAVQVLTDAGYR